MLARRGPKAFPEAIMSLAFYNISMRRSLRTRLLGRLLTAQVRPALRVGRRFPLKPVDLSVRPVLVNGEAFYEVVVRVRAGQQIAKERP